MKHINKNNHFYHDNGWNLWLNGIEPVYDNNESSIPTSYLVRATISFTLGGDRVVTTWSGLKQPDGSLGAAGWEDSDQWLAPQLLDIVPHAERVELGHFILQCATRFFRDWSSAAPTLT